MSNRIRLVCVLSLLLPAAAHGSLISSYVSSRGGVLAGAGYIFYGDPQINENDPAVPVEIPGTGILSTSGSVTDASSSAWVDTVPGIVKTRGQGTVRLLSSALAGTRISLVETFQVIAPSDYFGSIDWSIEMKDMIITGQAGIQIDFIATNDTYFDIVNGEVLYTAGSPLEVIRRQTKIFPGEQNVTVSIVYSAFAGDGIRGELGGKSGLFDVVSKLNFPLDQVPEPSSVILMASGALAVLSALFGTRGNFARIDQRG